MMTMTKQCRQLRIVLAIDGLQAALAAQHSLVGVQEAAARALCEVARVEALGQQTVVTVPGAVEG
jgi:hypothetical protein